MTNNILLSGGLSKLGVELIKKKYNEDVKFFIIKKNKTKNFRNDPLKKIFYLNINFLKKNIKTELSLIKKIKKN